MNAPEVPRLGQKSASRSLRQFRTSAATFGRQMFIPCAQKIFYYHGCVETVSTKRMRAQEAGLIGVPGLETAATPWKQRTATLPNSRYGGGPPFASCVLRSSHPFTRVNEAPLAASPSVLRGEEKVNRNNPTFKNPPNPLKVNEKTFSNRNKKALSGSTHLRLTSHESHD
jgi:hypothetical protein